MPAHSSIAAIRKLRDVYGQYTAGQDLNARVLPLGDGAFTIEFQEETSLELSARINGLASRARNVAGVIDVIPAFRALTICIDVGIADHAELIDHVLQLTAEPGVMPSSARRWTLPACYEGECAPDIEEVASTLGMAPDEVAALHAQAVQSVMVIGFLPGFSYIGPLPERLVLPRRKTPHLRVPPGTIAIATGLTAIYPWQSPGGWHLIGRTPIPLFDASRETPNLLAVGDQISFRSLVHTEYQELEAALTAGEIDIASFSEAVRS